MYEHFFNLSAEPFRLSPDHRFCYSHRHYAKAKAYMAYAFMRAEGFVMVTGRPGTGKTTLIGDLVESLADSNVAVANLVSTQLAADDLLRMVAFAFHLNGDAAEKSLVLQRLTTYFLQLNQEGGRALLIVDEAQDLTHKALEELRLLTNLQQDGKPLVQIFLLGQPELRDLVHSQGLEQVHQRIVAASHLETLREDETRAYVEHRLRAVHWRNDPEISAGVFPIIHLFSEGVPRRINLICSRLFLHCCVEQRHRITVADARSVVSELQEEQLSTRNLLHNELFLAPDVFEPPRMAPAPAVMASRSAAERRASAAPPPPRPASFDPASAAGAGQQSGGQPPGSEPPSPPRPRGAGDAVQAPQSAAPADAGSACANPAQEVPQSIDWAGVQPHSMRAQRVRSARRAHRGAEIWSLVLAAVLAGGLVAFAVWRDHIL
ncbi:MAG: AAA family ATPase [Halioglobus sp.]|nr:AAA family ATPase [Halioglobus sp.]